MDARAGLDEGEWSGATGDVGDGACSPSDGVVAEEVAEGGSLERRSREESAGASGEESAESVLGEEWYCCWWWFCCGWCWGCCLGAGAGLVRNESLLGKAEGVGVLASLW